MTKPILRIWQNRNYTVMVSGGVPSYITSWMQRVGMGWLAWEMTHSPLWLGIVAAADLAPMIFMGPFAGAITDRHNPLHQMRLSQSLLFVQALAMAIQDSTWCGAMSTACRKCRIALPCCSSAAFAVPRL